MPYAYRKVKLYKQVLIVSFFKCFSKGDFILIEIAIQNFYSLRVVHQTYFLRLFNTRYLCDQNYRAVRIEAYGVRKSI